MSYCINPHCPKPADPENKKNRICRNCGSELLLQKRYRVIRQLGYGGFSKTFEVDDSGIFKVLKVLTENNSKAIELFQQEAKVLSQLNSDGIPKVDSDSYFTFIPKNSFIPLHCLVMEKIEGVDLEQWMKSHNYQPISQSQAFNWLRQITEILTLVHDHQYFHRDIKPQNIMLRPSGQLVLIDFGAVRQVSTTILAGKSHTRIISQGYSPPEQQNGYSVQQSDFFALGRTFIFLLTGKEPQDKAIYNPLNNELNWRRYAIDISPLLMDLIDHLIAPNANQRPENTRVILQSLDDIEIENVLIQPYFLTKITKRQSKNTPTPTTFINSGQSSYSTTKRNHKKIKAWKWLIALSTGCLVIATFNGINNKSLFSFEVEKRLANEDNLKKELSIQAKNKREGMITKDKIDNIKLLQNKQLVKPQEKPRRKGVIQERNRQFIQTKPLKKSITTPKQQLGAKQKKRVNRQKTSNLYNYKVDATKPWEVKNPIPRASDELENVIRE